MNIKHIYIILVSAAVAACSSETLTEAKLSDELLNVEKEVNLTAIETERQVAVVADCHWEVSVSKSGWNDLTVQPMSGDGNGTLTLKTGQNSTVSERSATLTITSKGGLHQKITVRQTLGGATLTVNQSAMAFDAVPAASQSFTVTSNTAWTVLGLDSDWLTVEPSSGGSGTTEVKVTAQEIQDDRDRELTLTVALANGTERHDIHVTQAGKTNISLALTPDALEAFDATGGSQTVNVVCNARWYVDVPDNPDWLTLSTTSGVGNGTLTVNCQPNYSAETRFIRIYVTSGTRTPRQVSLAVSQKAGALPQFTTSLSLVESSLISHGAAFTFGYESLFPLTDHGLCYSATNSIPTVFDSKVSLGSGTTSNTNVTATLNGLTPLTTYYVRAYAMSEMAPNTPVYSNVITITTPGEVPSQDENPYPQMTQKRQ